MFENKNVNLFGLIYLSIEDAIAKNNGVNPFFGAGPYVVLEDYEEATIFKIRYIELETGVTGFVRSEECTIFRDLL